MALALASAKALSMVAIAHACVGMSFGHSWITFPLPVA
jgi:hypothetical protein